ncbi:hypothetical protein V8D89_000970 [Ganoderma adspersum]
MALQDLAPVDLAFRAEAGDRPSSVIPLIPSHPGSTRHNERPKPRQYGIPTCQPTDTTCWCSIAVNQGNIPFVNSACSQYAAVAQTTGLATLDSTTPHPPVASVTPPSASLNTHSATTDPRTLPSLPYPTTTGPSNPHPALSTPGVSADGSGGNGSPGSSAALSSSARTTEDGSTTRSSISSPTIPITSGSLLTPSPLPGAPSSVSRPPSSASHHLNTGTIVGIVLGALAALLAGALAVFLLFRKRAPRFGRSKSTRMSVESSESRQRLEAHSYQDSTSRPTSSMLTPQWLGSACALAPGGPDYEPKREPRAHSPAPTETETRPLAEGASVHSLHEGLIGVPAPFGHGDVLSASSELLALAGTDFKFAMANASNMNDGGGGLERSGSGLSRTTASSREVQSVEAL